MQEAPAFTEASMSDSLLAAVALQHVHGVNRDGVSTNGVVCVVVHVCLQNYVSKSPVLPGISAAPLRWTFTI